MKNILEHIKSTLKSFDWGMILIGSLTGFITGLAINAIIHFAGY
jgi:hypothetical protein